MDKNNSKPALLQALGFWDSVAIAVGIVIGVGIFRVPAEVAQYLTSPELIIFVWFLGGLISLIGASCYAELSSSIPETGGDYVYLSKSYGPLMGFLYGWTSLLVLRTGSIAAISFIFAEYLLSFLALDAGLVKVTAIAAVALLSFVNILGLRQGKTLQNISTIAKVLTLLAIIILGIFSGKGDISNFTPLTFLGGTEGLISLLGLALIPVLWTYGGWHEGTYVTGETRNAQRVLPRALIVGTLIITVLYILLNLVYIYLMPAAEIAQTNLIASNVMHVLFGAPAQKMVEALVVISAFGAINGMIITSGRITYALGKDHPIFQYLGRVGPRFSTPARSIVINGLWTVVLIIWGTFTRLLFFTGVLMWLYFGLIVIGIYVLRRKYPNLDRPYKVWGYPFIPFIFILACAWLVINTVRIYPFQSVVGILLALSGIPVYFISRKLVR
ncbi:MAG: amino acid permease [Candidatus Omnitrophota bacterium]|nr:MAG: amino acid permease [Candidatus Omnitrophota bacterium]